MERATRFTRICGILLLACAVVSSLSFFVVYPTRSILSQWLIGNMLINALPGALLWYLSRRMDRVELWAFMATAFFSILVVSQLFFASVMSVNPVMFIGALLLRTPMVYLIAAILNSMPHVLDGYRGYRQDKRLRSRGFDPIMRSTPLPVKTPPRPVRPKA